MAAIDDLHRALADHRRALDVFRQATERRDAAIRDAAQTRELSLRALSRLTGLSHQRIAQILDAEQP